MVNSTRRFLREFAREWLQDTIGRNAAAIAYYSVFSLPALLLIVLGLASSVIGSDAVSEEFFGTIAQYMGPRMADLLRQAVQNVRTDTPNSWTGWIGGALLLIAAIGVIRQVRISVNTIMHVPPARQSGVMQQLWTFMLSVMLLVLSAILILASVVGTAILSYISQNVSNILLVDIDLLSTISTASSYILLTSIFFLLYWLLPRARYPMRIILIVSLCTGALLMAGTVVLSLYISHSKLGHAYGVAASVLVLLFWMYYSAIVFLSGAECIDVASRLSGFQPMKQPRRSRKTVKVLLRLATHVRRTIRPYTKR